MRLTITALILAALIFTAPAALSQQDGEQPACGAAPATTDGRPDGRQLARWAGLGSALQ